MKPFSPSTISTTNWNDATKLWESPYETIVQLVIPRQDLETGEARANEKLIENTAFNPWNVFSNAFEPVGNMNRARQRVYQASAARRCFCAIYSRSIPVFCQHFPSIES